MARRLGRGARAVYASGDWTVNVVLSGTAFFYFAFLTTAGGLSPFWAGAAVWVARGIDAISDPVMGRLSDRIKLAGERRRPWFLLGSIPFGASFALMWAEAPFDAPLARWLYYTATYIVASLSMTVVSVPYLALIPEMATDYDERTEINTWRAAASIFGTLAAASMKPIADAFGGGRSDWSAAAFALAPALALPWLAVHRVSFERPDFQQRAVQIPIARGLRQLARHASFRSLAALYIASRISYDLISALFLLFFQHYLERSADFFPTLSLFLCVAVLAMPFWLRLAERFDKRSVFLAGCWWWLGAQLAIFAVEPSWPREVVFALAAAGALGFAVIDMVPWSMIGDVVDEDELASGERREGLYLGCFTFLRKLGGATGVFLSGVVLEIAGYRGNLAPGVAQSEPAIAAIRALCSLGPAAFLALAIVATRGYALTRSRHADILRQLAGRGLRQPDA
jgi:GPH family glycoside/pentoside/hexuronide:cation symporter